MKRCFCFGFLVACLIAFAHGEEGKMPTLRVATYNILHGGMVNLDYSVIGKDLQALALDIVGLQEIDQKTVRVKGADSMRALSKASGLKYYAFARAIDFQGGEYGTGILSRYPIKKFKVVPLESGKSEARALGVAVLDICGREVHFLNTHLSYENRKLRAPQFQQLAGILQNLPNYFLTADFNTEDLSEFDPLPRAKLLNRGQYKSYPEGPIAIDNIVFSPEWTLLSSGMGKEGHSDHNLLWGIFQFKK